jgi:hypothetical protein
MNTIPTKTPASIADSRRVRIGASFKLLPKPVVDSGRVRVGASFKLLRAV